MPTNYANITTKQLDYITYFRGIAILSIITSHTLCWGKSTMFNVNHTLFQGGTYFFIFIAGYLFQHLSYKFDTLTYYKKKFFNVICPYLFIITPVAYICSFQNNNFDILKNATPIHKFITIILNGWSVNGATWFMGMITVIFLISPLILKLKEKNKKIYLTAILMSFIMTIILPRQIAVYSKTCISFIFSNFYKMYILNAIHFLFFYILGMEIRDISYKYSHYIKNNLKNIFKISLFLYLFHFIINIFLVKNIAISQLISKTIEIFIILSGLMYCENKIKTNIILDKSLKFLANYSFGIFFIHCYIINYFIHRTLYPQNMIRLIDINHNNFKCALTSFKLFFATLFISIITLLIMKFLLKKLHIKNTRMFIGV